MYFLALNGVTRFALAKAIEAVHQNKLGHPFFPQPSELRKLCDDAMLPVYEQQRAERVADEARRDREQFESARARQTPEARARVAAIYAKYCESRKAPEEQFVSKLDPELLALVPDAPKKQPEPFKQARVA